MKVTPVKKFGKYREGEVFELPDKTARPFIKAGRIRAIIEEGASGETLEAEAPEVEISPRTGQPKRTYRRRDMQAE